jgi:hypothetical protein
VWTPLKPLIRWSISRFRALYAVLSGIEVWTPSVDAWNSLPARRLTSFPTLESFEVRRLGTCCRRSG